MALFPFGKKADAEKSAQGGSEREYFTPLAKQQAQQAGNDPQVKDLLRLVAIDACRKVDLDQQVRSCQVVSGGRGYTLLMKCQEHVDLTEAQLYKRMQAFEKRCGVVAHSRNIDLVDVFWAMPASLLQAAQHSGLGGNSNFAVSQMADFSASQFSSAGASSAFYPDASLVPWDAQDLPETGEIRKAPRGPTGGQPAGSGRSKLGLSDE